MVWIFAFLWQPRLCSIELCIWNCLCGECWFQLEGWLKILKAASQHGACICLGQDPPGSNKNNLFIYKKGSVPQIWNAKEAGLKSSTPDFFANFDRAVTRGAPVLGRTVSHCEAVAEGVWGEDRVTGLFFGKPPKSVDQNTAFYRLDRLFMIHVFCIVDSLFHILRQNFCGVIVIAAIRTSNSVVTQWA